MKKDVKVEENRWGDKWGSQELEEVRRVMGVTMMQYITHMHKNVIIQHITMYS